MTDSSLKGMHYEYTLPPFSCFSTPSQHIAAESCRNLVTLRVHCRNRKAVNIMRFVPLYQLFRHRWCVSNVKKKQQQKSSDQLSIFSSSVQGRKGNILTFLCNENCWTCHDISTDRLESFLLRGINHWWEDYSSVLLTAKLESAGFLVTQTYSVLFLRTASCMSSWPEWKMNFSIVTCLLVSFYHTCKM